MEKRKFKERGRRRRVERKRNGERKFKENKIKYRARKRENRINVDAWGRLEIKKSDTYG